MRDIFSLLSTQQSSDLTYTPPTVTSQLSTPHLNLLGSLHWLSASQSPSPSRQRWPGETQQLSLDSDGQAERENEFVYSQKYAMEFYGCFHINIYRVYSLTA